MNNKDSKLIFEAYNQSQLISEIPVLGPEDLGFASDPRKGASGGYGFKGLTDDQVKGLIDAVKTKLFKPAAHTVDGVEYQLYYPGSKDKFRVELINLIKNELKIGKTQAVYTARIADNLLNVIRTDGEGGSAASPVAVTKAVQAGAKNEDVTGKSAAAEVEGVYTRTGTPNFGKYDKISPRVYDELPDSFSTSDFGELKKQITTAARSAAEDMLDKKEKDEFFKVDQSDNFDYFQNFVDLTADYYKLANPEDTTKEPVVLEPGLEPDIEDIARREFGKRVVPSTIGDRNYTSYD